jgi:hypothetical protein
MNHMSWGLLQGGRMLSLYIYSEGRSPGSSEDAVALRVSYNNRVGAPPELYRIQYSICNSYGYCERTHRLRILKLLISVWFVVFDLLIVKWCRGQVVGIAIAILYRRCNEIWHKRCTLTT